MTTLHPDAAVKTTPDFMDTIDAAELLADFRTCCISREVSLLARREVLTGKAKFGISGDGKEVPQVAMARAFQRGDFRSGYYRDQTFMFALGLLSVEDYFAQLYADPHNDPASGGRQMNCHFATPTIAPDGQWTRHKESYNVSADIAPTAGQMGRALGLALASKQYRSNPKLQETGFSHQGREVSFCTIGDASTSEGAFWETINAAVVQQVPLAVFVWDDGYGISVPKEYQTAMGSISQALRGMEATDGTSGLAIYRVKGWDYPALVETFIQAVAHIRDVHQPALFHIEELTQPQGHSTSGSHERYKSTERLQWEKDNDGIVKMEQWLIAEGVATPAELAEIRKAAKVIAKAGRDKAWQQFNTPARQLFEQLQGFYASLPSDDARITALRTEISQHTHPQIHEILSNARRLVYRLRMQLPDSARAITQWLTPLQAQYDANYAAHLHSDTVDAAVRVPVIAPRISTESPSKNGYEILNAFFDYALERYPAFYAFGEDVGGIGGVNQSFVNMQKKYGEERVFDTGIREWTIMGQGIGMAMRGLRPVAEIQYLDYMLYALSPLSDDLATLRWRTNGQQKAPVIIRTRGHRLEGIWHSGSPMGVLLHALRGIHVCVPRNMVQAAGMYNTLLQAGEPGIVVERLNGYRQKEVLPDNMGQYTVPLGVPEVVMSGTDITLVTYGSCVPLAEQACALLAEQGIHVELVDVQTLLPFDLEHRTVASIQKTNRLLIVDEDVPGGASAFMLRQLLEEQQAYRYLDAAPQTLTAKAHRPAYGSDGDYFSKPSVEDIVDAAYYIMHEASPSRFPI